MKLVITVVSSTVTVNGMGTKTDVNCNTKEYEIPPGVLVGTFISQKAAEMVLPNYRVDSVCYALLP